MTKPLAYLVEFENGPSELWLASDINGPPAFGETVTPLVPQQEWMPIETAPIQPFDKARWYAKHSDYLLVLVDSDVQIASYHFTERGKGSWRGPHRACNPTHWQPLPEPRK